MGRGEPAAIGLTSAFAASPRLDQIAALDQLVQEAQRGEISPADGLRRLDAIRSRRPRFSHVGAVGGLVRARVGTCLVLHPAPLEVVAAAVFGGLVGILRSLVRRQRTP